MKIIYWSGTGNTEEMAGYIANGIKSEGKDVEVLQVSSVNFDEIVNEDILILGCSSMGCEELESDEFEPFIESLEGRGAGKKAILFGSYGWGNGEWMVDFEEKMKSYNFELPLKSLIVNYAPEGEDIDKCIKLGVDIANI